MKAEEKKRLRNTTVNDGAGVDGMKMIVLHLISSLYRKFSGCDFFPHLVYDRSVIESQFTWNKYHTKPFFCYDHQVRLIPRSCLASFVSFERSSDHTISVFFIVFFLRNSAFSSNTCFTYYVIRYVTRHILFIR